MKEKLAQKHHKKCAQKIIAKQHQVKVRKKTHEKTELAQRPLKG